MNQQNSQGSQIFRFLLLALAGFFLWNSFNQQRNEKPAVAPRPAIKLVEAFNNIAPSQGQPLTKASAPAEIKRLAKLIAVNPKDEVAMWAHLRTGLIQQYVLGDLKSAQRKGGFLGLGARVIYYPPYDAVIANAANDNIEAQALYQTGDLQWRESVAKSPDKKASPESIAALQTLVTKGRGASAFLDTGIYVPKSEFNDRPADPQLIPLSGIPADGFTRVTVRDLHGSLQNPNPAGIVDRVDAFYRDSTYYKSFDMMAQVLGRNPAFSYGLAILIFAVFLRTIMQPIYKKQYESMKGMALLGPEMKKIQAKYKDSKDPSAQMQMMKETRALQAEHGVNPLTGCGLGLIQLPVLLLVVYPFIQHYEPHMELVGASFLWINSLVRPDIPLLIIYGFSQFLSTRLMATPPADEMQKQQQMMMSFVMPVIFPFFLLSFPSALTLYWTASNILNMVFMWRSMKLADPSKSIVRTLSGADLVVANPTADAVPARPGKDDTPAKKKEKPALQSGKPGLDLDRIAGSNGHLNGGAKNGNGSSNGAFNGSSNGGGGEHHAAPEGSVMKSETRETKRGGRRGKKKR